MELSAVFVKPVSKYGMQYSVKERLILKSVVFSEV